MLTIKIVGHIAALIIAVFALFRKTSEENNLTNLGKGLIFFIFVLATANISVVLYEHFKKNERELEAVEAKRVVYGRLVGAVERAKHAFLWKDYDFRTVETAPFDYENASSVFMNPDKKDLKSIESKVVDHMELYLRSMNSARDSYLTYLSFKEADSLLHFLSTMEVTNIRDLTAEYKQSSGFFSDYLIENGLNYSRLEYLFLSLNALEEDIKTGYKENENRFYELRPECRDPGGIEMWSSCS